MTQLGHMVMAAKNIEELHALLVECKATTPPGRMSMLYHGLNFDDLPK